RHQPADGEESYDIDPEQAECQGPYTGRRDCDQKRLGTTGLTYVSAYHQTALTVRRQRYGRQDSHRSVKTRFALRFSITERLDGQRFKATCRIMSEHSVAFRPIKLQTGL